VVTESARSANLAKIDHIVVLMLENRSFDHMLGYLSLDRGRGDIDGLRPEFCNEHGGRAHPVHHLDTRAIPDDPDHSAAAVDLQLGDGAMSGFVASYARTLSARGVPDLVAGRVMGYYGGADVPVYDHLASEFAVCDRWFSSVPGATWPNRLYAICGSAAGSRDDLPLNLPPLYHRPSFVRHLDAHDVSWRWYSFETGSLRLADRNYRLGHHDRFAFFSHTILSWKTRLERSIDPETPSFIEDAARGALPSVAWIDPNFSNFDPIGFPPNDDHVPADIGDGQDLVLAVYHALTTSAHWERTLLIVVYDEHGGFFDHVAPPEAPDDDPETFGRYGVRVPALIVSPWIEPGSVSHTLFDHTSIIKTILMRFCPDALTRPAGRDAMPAVRRRGGRRDVGVRVAQANDLGELLTLTAPRAAAPYSELVDSAAERAAARAAGGLVDEGARKRTQATDLQVRIAAARRELTRLGHPEGRP
jgi:phospholipase C